MSIRLTATDDALRQGFASLTTRDSVARLLDVDPKLLRYYLYKAHNYRTFDVPKRSGSARRIATPANALKIIQRKLNQVLHAVYQGRSPVHGFVRERSIKTNALRHMGCELVFNFDLEDFFPSIHFGRVMGLFGKKPYALPEQVARTLAQICCHEKALPTGAPTSPIVANMMCAAMDSQLKQVARKFGCMYTRYADDITFSTRAKRFHPSIVFRDATTKIWNVGDEVRNIIQANIFKINAAKTHVRNRDSRQEITGVKINAGLNVRQQLLRQVRAMLHAWETFGESAAEAEFRNKYDRKLRKNMQPAFRAVLRGKIEFIGFIRGRDDALYLRLLMRLLFLDDKMKARPVVATATTKDKVLEQAVWLLISENGDAQATAFSVEGFDLLTAFHAVEHVARQGAVMYATRPGYDDRRYPITVAKYDEVRDVAQLTLGVPSRVELKIGPNDHPQVGQQITLLGFRDTTRATASTFTMARSRRARCTTRFLTL